MSPRASSKRLPSRPLLWSAGIAIAMLMGCAVVGLAVAPAVDASPAPLPGASSPPADITVIGIGGGQVRVALVEVGGRSIVVGVGDRIGSFTVKVISGNGVVLARGNQTFRLPLASGGASPPVATAPAPAVPKAVTVPAPAGTPTVPSAPAAGQPPQASASPQPAAGAVSAATQGSTADTQSARVPVGGAPLAPAPPTPPAIPPGAVVDTPSGTSVYGFKSAPITTQSAVTQQGVTALPVASNNVQPGGQVLPSAATLYTPSGTSVYGITTGPITTQSAVTQQGTTALPVASNQAQSAAQVSPRPTYQVELAPISDEARANDIAGQLVKAGFTAKIDATTDGQYIVKLTPPPQSTVSGGLAVFKSTGVDVPIKVEILP